MTNNPLRDRSAHLPPVPPASADTVREGRQRHPMAGPSDAEKYRWIRANRGNFAIVEALAGCDKDADFDDRIAGEMAMCAAGRGSYRLGDRP